MIVLGRCTLVFTDGSYNGRLHPMEGASSGMEHSPTKLERQ
jgi:hypothetical protein